MPTRLSRFYNDPKLGTGLENLAAVFAPPEATDQLAGQKALETADKRKRLSAFFDQSQNPAVTREQLDRTGLGSGSYAPSQSFAAIDMNNTAAGARNDADNRTKLQQTTLTQRGDTDRAMLAPVAEGATRFVPEGIAKYYGTGPTQVGGISLKPDEKVITADGRELQGNESADTPETVKGKAMAALSPEDLHRIVMTGAGTPINVRNQGGGTQMVYPADAIGQQQAPTPTAPTMVGNYSGKDGTGGPAILDNGTVRNAQTQTPIPADSTVYSTAVQGKKDDALGAGTQSNIDQQGINLSLAENTSKQLRQLVTTNPAAQGLVGSIRGTVQDVLATGGEVGKLLNVNVQQMQRDIAAGRIDPEVAARLGNFDPSIPAAKLLETMLTAQVAKVLDPEGRISNDRYKVVEGMLGSGGLLGNSQRTIAALDALDNIIGERRKLLGPSQSPGVTAIAGRSAGATPAPAAPQASAAPASAAPAGAQRRRYNPATGAIE